MNKDVFWDIIDVVKEKAKGDNNKRNEYFDLKLATLSIEDLLHFQFIYEIYEIAVISAPSNLIWTAQFIINKGYYSNTYNFAGWLISHGKRVYLKALYDADTLAETTTPDKSCEYDYLRFLASRLYREKTGVKIRAFKKIESEFWNKAENRKDQTEINNEIILSDLKRNPNWVMSDLKTVLPKLYSKLIKS